MARRLEKGKASPSAVILERNQNKPFRICFEVPLTNGFEVKDMREKDLKELQRFLEETVYKELTISQVDELYLRKRGMGSAPAIMYGDMELYHYGKDRNPFRLFGYYNRDNYFVVVRIDTDHKTHRG